MPPRCRPKHDDRRNDPSAAASARYQVGQVDAKVDAKFDAQVDKASAVVAAEPEKVASSARITPATATIELIISVGAKQISANFAMPVDVRKVLTPADHRSTSNAPANAAINVPIAVTPGAKELRGAREPVRRPQMIPIRPQAISGGRASRRESQRQPGQQPRQVSPSDLGGDYQVRPRRGPHSLQRQPRFRARRPQRLERCEKRQPQPCRLRKPSCARPPPCLISIALLCRTGR